MPPPDGRFLVALDHVSLVWAPSWHALDQVHPSLVTSYTIDRGRQYELDRTDTGRAVVEIADQHGFLDPTNPEGPYYGKIEPLRQVMLRRRNPVTGEWHTRFRGFIEEFDYAYDPGAKVYRLTVQCVDLFEILAAIEMYPSGNPAKPAFGNQVPANSNAEVWFDFENECRERMEAVLGNAKIPTSYYVLFSGNVMLWPTSYSFGENVLTVITEAADAEFPGVGNVYVDRFGRLVFHGRMAKFDPDSILSQPGFIPDHWDYHEWRTGDGTAVNANPDVVAHIREFAFDRGLSKIINNASATPLWSNAKNPNGNSLTYAEQNKQQVSNDTSIGTYGFRSWSAQNLLTMKDNIDGANSMVATKRFATYYVDNYNEPQNRITTIGFRSMNPDWTGAPVNWDLLCELDISDSVAVTIGTPGTDYGTFENAGGFYGEEFYVEGVHEESHPLEPDYDDVTVRLDLSPRAYFDTNPWGT